MSVNNYQILEIQQEIFKARDLSIPQDRRKEFKMREIGKNKNWKRRVGKDLKNKDKQIIMLAM